MSYAEFRETIGYDVWFSIMVLYLIRQAFDGHIPFKVINIDTSVKFPEIYAFRD